MQKTSRMQKGKFKILRAGGEERQGKTAQKLARGGCRGGISTGCEDVKKRGGGWLKDVRSGEENF